MVITGVEVAITNNPFRAGGSACGVQHTYEHKALACFVMLLVGCCMHCGAPAVLSAGVRLSLLVYGALAL